MALHHVRGRRSTTWFEFVHIPPDAPRENTTIDVASKGCFFDSYDTVACVRNGLLSVFITVTFLLCLGRIVKLHLVKHPQVHQFFIFYFAAVECLLCGVNWVIGSHLPQIDFSASYLKLLQFIVICHLHWTLATRILHQERLVKRVIIPILVLYFAYFTTIAVLGMTAVKSSWTECLEPEWLLLSAVEFLVVQLFMIAGIYITKKINTVSTVESFKRAQKRDLWSVIVAYEMSALVSVTYDVTMLILGSDKHSCSAIFGHVQLLYSPVFALFMMFKFMLPIWTMLCVFHPVPTTVIDPETVLGWSFDGTTSTSMFSPANREHHFYKQLHHPGSETHAVITNGSGTNDTFLRQPGNPIARSHTAPAAFFSAILKRSPAGLAPITEEETTNNVRRASLAAANPNNAGGTDKPKPKPTPDKPSAIDEQPLLNSDGSSVQSRPSSIISE